MIRVLCLSGFLMLIVVMMVAMPALAQSPTTGDDTPLTDVKYFDFFVVKGGYIAFGLIALSIVTVALTLEHCLSIRRATIVPADAARRAESLIADKKYVDAIKFTAEDPSMIGYVLNACLVEAANGFDAMERALEDALEERSARLFRKIEYVNIIGNVAPMIGLLGTVTGMILLFAEIHAADSFPGARIVADRIAIALITTFWGLAVAIPALSIYAIFRNRIDVLTAECASSAEHIMAVFKPATPEQVSSGVRPIQGASPSE